MLLEARGVTKVYPMGIKALDSVDLVVDRGDFVGIMGRSGSGKSTLLHILGCLDRPSTGTVSIDGVVVTQVPDRALPPIRAQKLGFVFQAHNLLRTLTALENTLLPLRYLRPRPPDAMERARAALEAVGLGDRMHHLPTHMSGGQQQRVAIARALVNRPAIVLADEPTGALDSQTANDLLTLLRRLGRELGQTFLIVTHDPIVGRVCDRIITMVDGRVEGVG